MSYDPKAIANDFLSRARGDGVSLSPMKLQKLVSFAHGWWLALTGRPLIHEQVEAWAFGPVIPSLHRAFRRFGNGPISETASLPTTMESVDRSETDRTVLPVGFRPEESESLRLFLDRVWEIYGKYSAIRLANATHQPGTPWHQVYCEYGGDIPKGTDIPTASIREYFRSLAKPKAVG